MERTAQLKHIFTISILFLIVLVCLAKTKTLDLKESYSITNHFRTLQYTDITIVNDALKVQSQLTKNYDKLTKNCYLFHQELQTLQQQLVPFFVRGGMTMRQPLEELKMAEATRNLLVEDLKSDYAVLKNSLDYLSTVSSLVLQGLTGQNERTLYETVVKLQIGLLNYQSASDDLSLNKTIKEQINIIAKTVPRLSEKQKAVMENLLIQAQLIMRVKPDINWQLTNLTHVSTHTAIDSLARAYEHYNLQLSSERKFYRMGLYGTSILLLIYILFLYRIYRQAVALKVLNANLEIQVAERTESLNQTLATLKKSQTQLVHTEKMSSLGQLVAGIAHEVNNPVNFIHGNLHIADRYSRDLLDLIQLYKQQYKPTSAITEREKNIDLDFLKHDYLKLLASMLEGTRRVSSIVKSLRTFARLDQVKSKSVNIHDGLESVLLMLQHQLLLKEQSSIIQVIRDYNKTPPITCYPGQLNQVLMNLLVNAIDALKIAPNMRGQVPTITIKTSVQDKHLLIQITDNGPGIPDNIKTQIFDPFFTTKPVGQGTGLGLSISYQIVVDLHGGSLSCTSHPDVGTQFCIQLPMDTTIENPIP